MTSPANASGHLLTADDETTERDAHEILFGRANLRLHQEWRSEDFLFFSDPCDRGDRQRQLHAN
jgi:hypothetical protein